MLLKILDDNFWMGFGLGMLITTIVLMVAKARAMRAYRSMVRLLLRRT